ncbi:TolC family outer membrane protein [Hydrocarboniphaga effusa]|jgi:outer membrane protein|uniref:TolC family outer membrane protein n=1 Tax=Hydrocarboniphaga effusa TaxID=243629 RepID=UPI0031380424
MTFRLPLLCLPFALCVLPPAAQAGDLLRFFEMAQRNDAQYNASLHARDVALEAEPSARALLLPQVQATYSQTFNDSDTTVRFEDPTTGIPVELARHNGGTDKNLGVSLTQPLFDLESWRRLQQAGEQTALAELNFRASRQALLLRTADVYFQLLSANDALALASAEKDALASQLELAQQNLELGQSSIIDVQDVQARYDLSLASELEAEQQVTAATAGLDAITREPLRKPIEPGVQVVSLEDTPAPAPRRLARLPDGTALPKAAPAVLQAWIDLVPSSLDVTAALLNYNIASRGVDVAQARYFPRLDATLSYQDFKTKSGSFPTDADGTAIRVGVTVPLFAGGATRSGVRSAVALRDERMAEYDAALREAERATRVAYQAVLSGTARSLAFQRAVTSSLSALDASQTGLEIGTRSAIDVLNAQQQRYQAQRNFTRSRYDYLVALLRLKASVGQLDPEDLAEVDALLTTR